MAMHTLLLMLCGEFGDVQEQMSEVNSYITTVYFWTYFVICYFVLMNALLAIVVQAYESTKAGFDEFSYVSLGGGRSEHTRAYASEASVKRRMLLGRERERSERKRRMLLGRARERSERKRRMLLGRERERSERKRRMLFGRERKRRMRARARAQEKDVVWARARAQGKMLLGRGRERTRRLLFGRERERTRRMLFGRERERKRRMLFGRERERKRRVLLGRERERKRRMLFGRSPTTPTFAARTKERGVEGACLLPPPAPLAQKKEVVRALARYFRPLRSQIKRSLGSRRR
jgi:hypothetical protein